MAEKVLLVDIEDVYLPVLKELLQSAGYVVDTAETLTDASCDIKESAYNTVIADIRLAGTLSDEGLAILDDARKSGKRPKLIVITGFESVEIMKSAFLKGADYYFEKPVAFMTIVNAIQEQAVH